MKLYIRLFFENSATKFIPLFIILAIVLQINPYNFLQLFPKEMQWTIKYFSLYIPFGMFWLTDYGLSPVKKYKRILEEHDQGEDIQEYAQSKWPCYRAAYKVAIKDLEKQIIQSS